MPVPPQVTEQEVHSDQALHSAEVEDGVVVDRRGTGQASGLQASLSLPSPEHVLDESVPDLHSPVLVLSPPPQVTEQSLHADQQPH